MKKLLLNRKRVFAFLLALCLGMGTAFASDFSAVCPTGQTLYYNIIDATNHYVEITYPGTSNNWWDGFDKPTGDITFPTSVDHNGVTYTVTRIGLGAFFGCSDMTGSLTIPDSVTTIGDLAFWNCSGFTGSLTIPNSVTTIKGSAFAWCEGITGSLTIPNSVITIESMAFYQCSGLTGSLTIPNSVTSIGWNSFSACYGINGMLTIGSSVTSIGDEAFFNCINLSSINVLPETPPTFGTDAFANVSTDIPVYVPCGSLETYQEAVGWGGFTNLQCIPETLTVYEGISTEFTVPANITYFDDFTRSQFVIPADDLVEMIGTPITRLTFYTTNEGVPYTTVSSADVYLKEVNYTAISAFEPKASATIVYSGYFNIMNSGDGGEMTINFDTPYTYNGGNLLVGIENTEDNGWTNIEYYGQSVSGASISGSSSVSPEAISAEQQNFIPKTTFGFVPTCEAKSLPYAYGFEEADDMECWTMLDCHASTGIHANARHTGDYGFRFYYNTTPPQFLISPKFEGTSAMIVSFYYKNFNDAYPETFQVGYSTTTKSPTAFAWDNELTADNSTWTHYENIFPAGTKYVAVKLTSNDQFFLFLDDFSFEPVTPCNAPSNLTVTNITSNSAYLYWTGDQENYNVRYRMVPDGSWIVETAFPNSFVDNFESGLGNWTLIDADGDGHNWGLKADLHLNASPHGGDELAISESWTHADGGLDPDNFLVTPQVALGGTVTFWASAVDHIYSAEHFGIAVSTGSNTDPADFTMVQEWTMTAKGEPHGGPRGTRSQGTWYQYTVDLSAFAGQTGYIAIRHFNCPDQDALCVDDFSYGDEIPGITLGGLSPLTTYEVQVQHICPYDFSEWSEPVSFTTAIPTFPYGDYIGTALYDLQTNFGARTWTHVWPDGKVNFAFTTSSMKTYSDRGTGIGTYDSTNDVWIPSMGRVENERTGFGTIAQYGANGIVVAAHTNTSNIYIIPDKDDIAAGSAVRVGSLDSTHEPYWPNVMTSGANRDIIHVIAQAQESDNNMLYYFRSRDGGQTWDRQNEILPYMGTDYCINWMANCYYWMETTEDNCLALVVNNRWSDGMVLYSYDDGDTWERKVFYKHPDPFGSFEVPFYYPRWTSCQWDSQHHLHVLYELGAVDSNYEHLDLGGVAYWNETMPYDTNGNTVSAFEGNLVPGQPFVMESAYLENDIYRSWWHYTDATHEMWPEYIGYLAPLTDDGDPEDPYQATEFNIENENLGQHGYYRSGVCSFPVLCMVPNSNEMVAVWSALDENHTDVNGNYYYKIFASYSNNRGATWSPMIQLTKDFDNAEFVYNQAAVVGRKLVIATQTDGETGTYVYFHDSDVYDSYYLGMVFDLDDLFDTSSPVQTIELSEGWNWVSTYIDLNEVNGIAMLEEALGDYGVTIQTYNESADYFGDGEWSGLEDYEWTNAEMVMVEVSEDCTIDIAGPTVDPGTVEIEIHPGWNWIGFPVATETAIGVAMAGFEAEEEDAIQSNVDGTSDYLDEWVGDVLTLVPGQGYMYYSNSTETKTLVFSTTAKGKGVITRKRKE